LPARLVRQQLEQPQSALSRRNALRREQEFQPKHPEKFTPDSRIPPVAQPDRAKFVRS
jgi:hypothetical protein